MGTLWLSGVSRASLAINVTLRSAKLSCCLLCDNLVNYGSFKFSVIISGSHKTNILVIPSFYNTLHNVLWIMGNYTGGCYLLNFYMGRMSEVKAS